ncbi:alpha/beta fold hydrolase [Pseudoduganella sp. UC29_106]|uniref:alpha/beta fold hydrolase n=1 Tax=Pseudoduganella sp. UC29_106 TaxID=3374553 RepID=UPI003757B033
MLRPLLAAALIATAAMPALASAACAAGQKVQEKGLVPIGGIQQWVTISGRNCANPVVLVLHGGPGNPLSPYSKALYGGWEKEFTIVQWDQRGAGMTYGASKPAEDEPLTIEQMRDDGIALAEYLAKKFDKQKITLIGGSWSSVLAVHMIKARPDLFEAYVGAAQIVSYRENPHAAYQRLLAVTRRANDTEAVKQLEALGTPPWTDPHNFGIMRRVIRKYEAQVTEPAPKAWWKPSPEYATPEAMANYEGGEDYSYIQFVGMRGDGMYSRVDLPKLGTSFKVPFYLLQGEEDLLTTPDVARRYFDSISAPQKEFILLPRVGHDPNPTLVAAQYKLLKEHLQP